MPSLKDTKRAILTASKTAAAAAVQPAAATRKPVVFEQIAEPAKAIPGDVWVEASSERTVFVQTYVPQNAVPGDVWITQ